MSDKSAIEWTDATWNPTVGCSIVSPGCTNCYAMKTAHGLERRFDSKKYAGLTKVVHGNPVWTGEVRLNEDALRQPLKWKRGRKIFVNSMSDLFHEALPDEAIDRVFAVMALCPQHTFQVLTKRAERMRRYMTTADDEKLGLPKGEGERRDHIAVSVFALNDELSEGKSEYAFTDNECLVNDWPLKNVWLGISAERQQEWDERTEHLRNTPGAVHFVSAEPLLGPIVGGPETMAALDWMIVGGESGPRARPMHPDWARSLRDQCTTAGVYFFFKQWGEWTTDSFGGPDGARAIWLSRDGTAIADVSDIDSSKCAKPLTLMFKDGKHRTGRLLDGKEHSEFPRVAA